MPPNPQREALVMAREALSAIKGALDAFADEPVSTREAMTETEEQLMAAGRVAKRALTAIDAALAAPVGGDGWQPIETAPKDGSWFLLRGRNSAGAPMIPVVVAWRGGVGANIGSLCFRDSASLRDLTGFIADHPPDSKPDWHPLPTQDGGDG